jgi:hypothetical protein
MSHIGKEEPAQGRLQHESSGRPLISTGTTMGSIPGPHDLGEEASLAGNPYPFERLYDDSQVSI